MNQLSSNPAFTVYVLASAALAFNLLGLAFYTAATRARILRVVNPEDVSVVRGGTVADVEAPEVLRAQRAHRNALENIAPFLAVGLLYVLCGASARGAWIYFGVFVAARLLHSAVYLAGRQPWRTALFAVGALATIDMAVQTLIAVL